MALKGERWLAVRRGLDVVVVALALPILAVVLLAASAAIVVFDRHGPFVRLERVGRGGESLMVTKLQSMRPNAGPAITSSADGRVTRVGASLRKLRVDEIPQVLSVLRGDMALIGPRPETPQFVDLNDARWAAVLRCRPAIAGLSQVIVGQWEATNLNVPDAEVRYAEVAVPAKLTLDAWYADNASPVLDAKIVVAVFQMLVLGRQRTAVHRMVQERFPDLIEASDRVCW